MIAVLLLLIISPGAVSAVWSVTFENPNYCAVKGSSVELRCLYNYPAEETVRKTAWHKGDLRNGKWIRVELSQISSLQNRSEYVGDLQHNCSLVIHDLQENDTGHYYFWFDTQKYGRRSQTFVYLQVTELNARVSPQRVRPGDRVTLECTTSCQVPSTVWLKDGRPVTEPEFQARPEDAGNYSCVVEGQESLKSDPVAVHVWYPPVNVSVGVSHAGLLTVGSSVNLTCSSAANPAADYMWYRGAVSSSSSLTQVGSGQVLSIPSLEASHSGLYLCQARNRLGANNSTEVMLTVGKTDINRLILLVGIGVKVVIVLLLTPVIIWVWKRWCNSAADNEVDSHDYEHITIT